MPTSASEQLKILLSAAERVVPEEEFVARIERSVSEGRPLRVKLGIDPSAPDIHLGHAVPLRALRRFQQLGHTAVLIIGDFTGRVGDPSGRSETRRALTEEEVRAHAATYVEQVTRILLPEPLEIRWNSEWLVAIGAEGLLALAGRMTVARMLERDDFAKRYADGRPISIVEFLYPLLQGQDSVAVRADVEIGGTDQTFNLLVGRDLQRNAGQEPQVAYVLPLLEGLDGVQKMSKSLGNYVGVTDPPEEMFGKLMSVPDALLGKYLRLATDLRPDEISALETRAGSGGPEAALVKRRLAAEIVALYHGAEAAAAAERRFDVAFVEHGIPENVQETELPESARPVAFLPGLMVDLGLAKSKAEARRLIEQEGVRLDGDVVRDFDVAAERLVGRVLQVGRRRFVRIRG